MEEMLLPTVDQTEGVWIVRTGDQGHHYIQEVFPRETAIEQAHRTNCLMLIQRGSLQPEHDDHRFQRTWSARERYCRTHV